jgi:hypothetical protein
VEVAAARTVRITAPAVSAVVVGAAGSTYRRRREFIHAQPSSVGRSCKTKETTMPASTTRILRRTAAVSVVLGLAVAPAALARPADEGPTSAAASAAAQQAPVTIIGHRVPDALSMRRVPSAVQPSTTISGHRVPDALSMQRVPSEVQVPTTIVGHRVPDALSMQRVPPAAQPAGDSGSVDSMPWLIAAAVAALGLAGGIAIRRSPVRLTRRHAGV